jgi:hypothetical protein
MVYQLVTLLQASLDIGLQFRLEVIHLTRIFIITQDTDDQSHGAWAQKLNRGDATPTISIFPAARCTSGLLGWAVSHVSSDGPLSDWNVETYLLGWNAPDILHHSTLWLVNPLIAR